MKAIIFIGPIGSGKGTQAETFAKKLGFFHFETSRFLEQKFALAKESDRELFRQKTLWTQGILLDPVWVTQTVLEETEKLSHTEKGLIFSSSPRTIFEAEQEMPVFEKFFGKENILIFNILLSETESVKRNSGRRICQKNRHPIPNFPEFKNIVVCPEDGSPLITRELDKPEIIKVRYREYLNRTQPILAFLRQRGYQIVEINGEQPIEDVSKDITQHL